MTLARGEAREAGQDHNESLVPKSRRTTAAQPPRGSEGGQLDHGWYPPGRLDLRSRRSMKRSAWSFRYKVKLTPICRRLERQAALWLRCLARASAGRRREARIAMMAMTTRSSIRVKARRSADSFVRAIRLRWAART